MQDLHPNDSEWGFFKVFKQENYVLQQFEFFPNQLIKPYALYRLMEFLFSRTSEIHTKMYFGKYAGKITKKLSRKQEIQECSAFQRNRAHYD